jgi:hypothetical protein
MVVNDKEKESFVNDPKDDKPTDSGSGHKRKDERKKKTRRIKEIVYYDSDESSSSQKDDDNDYEKRRRLIQTFPLIILIFRKVPMLIVTPQVLPWLWHIYALMTVITCGRNLKRRV